MLHLPNGARLDGDEETVFTAVDDGQAGGDGLYAADIAEATGTSPALLPALQGFFDEIVERGYGERDITVSRRVVAER